MLQLTGANLTAEGAVEAGAAEGPIQAASVLFSAVPAGDCQRSDPARAPDAAEARTAWSLAPDPWPGLAKALSDQPQTVLQAVWSGLCEEQR